MCQSSRKPGHDVQDTSWRRQVRKLQCADRCSTRVSFVPFPVPSCCRLGIERDNKRRAKWHSVDFIRSAGRSGQMIWLYCHTTMNRCRRKQLPFKQQLRLNLFISSLQWHINLQANKQKYEKGLEKKL